MKIYVIVSLLIIANSIPGASSSVSEIPIGYQVTIAVPSDYAKGFLGRAFIMDIDKPIAPPNFKAAISVEAVEDKYACSLDIFLGQVRVWSSGHLSRFYTTEICVLELTPYGDLRLKGLNQRIGWRSGTSGQGVQRLQLLRSGNLVLVDELNLIKWQTFNFPTDIMLWGQRLSSRTRLTSFPSVNKTMFYSFEIQYDRMGLYLNFGKWKYSYWEYRPPLTNRNITFIQLTSNGLDIFDGKYKFDEIRSIGSDPLRFLALENSTGNLRLYHYSDEKEKFEASYQALNFTCDLPLTCKSYGICTTSGSCSCIRLMEKDIQFHQGPDCKTEKFEGLCGKNEAEMLELRGVASVLRSVPDVANVGKNECANICLDDCTCVAAQYEEEKEEDDDDDRGYGECFLYRIANGIKQVERGGKVSYMVKVPKGTNDRQGKNSVGLKKWVIVVVVVVDGFIILLVLSGLGYYVVRKRQKDLPVQAQAQVQTQAERSS